MSSERGGGGGQLEMTHKRDKSCYTTSLTTKSCQSVIKAQTSLQCGTHPWVYLLLPVSNRAHFITHEPRFEGRKGPNHYFSHIMKIIQDCISKFYVIPSSDGFHIYWDSAIRIQSFRRSPIWEDHPADIKEESLNTNIYIIYIYI